MKAGASKPPVQCMRVDVIRNESILDLEGQLAMKSIQEKAMSKRFRGMPALDKARLALPAGVLALCLAALWPGAAQGQGGTLVYKKPVIDSATDDGGGKIRVAWSWQRLRPDEKAYPYVPETICVRWGIENVRNKACFTSEISTRADLVFDTGIEEGKSAVYRVLLRTNYPYVSFFSSPAIEVTVNN